MIAKPTKRALVGILLTSLIANACVQTRPREVRTSQASEVRQIVTFGFVPGASTEAVEVFRQHAIPLYHMDKSMWSFRGYREIESPVALDLIVVSRFEGIASQTGRLLISDAIR